MKVDQAYYEMKRQRVLRMIVSVANGSTFKAVGQELGVTGQTIRVYVEWGARSIVHHAILRGFLPEGTAVGHTPKDVRADREMWTRLADALLPKVETIPTMWQILADVQNGSLTLLDANMLAKAHLRAAEIRGERKRSKGVTQ